MKGMTGFQLLEKLKAEGLKTPLVFMSGHIDKTVKEEAISKGARAVLFKPFDFKEILQFFPS
jgi:CheY-like chemotaxis protein